MRYETASGGTFYPIWKKYKPVIVQMMKQSIENDVQQYALSKHEFEDVKPVQNMVIPFTVLVKSGTISKMEKKSLPAEDLINLLKTSETAVNLLNSFEFSFQLDREFTFHISAKKPEGEE